MNLEQARKNMVEQQIRPWDVLSQRVLDVLLEIPRHNFVPEPHQDLAYSDSKIPLGHGQTMMNPNLEGRVLQALQIHADDKILEVGTGTGYLTACLATLGKEVESVEFHEDLAKTAQQNLSQQQIKNVNIVTGNAAQGWGDSKSYDAIAITGSLPNLPEEFKQALRIGGRLFCILGSSRAPIMHAWSITRVGETDFSETCLFETSIGSMQGASEEIKFSL